MKKILYSLISAALILATTVSCEDLTDVPSNVPVITTGNAYNVFARWAMVKKTLPVSGTVYSNYEYLMIDTTESFRDTIQVNKTETYSKDSVCWICTNLQPSTKYYYRQCASDGLEYVYGETKSFTTSKLVGIGSVKLDGWTGGTTPSSLAGVELGAYLVNSHGYCNYSNVPVKGNADGTSWYIGQDILPTKDTCHIYVYAPYTSTKDSFVYVGLYKYNTDLIYGKSDGLNEENVKADITMYHAFADVVFSVKRADNDNVGSSFSTLYLYDADKQDSILAEGYFNVISEEWTKMGTTSSIARYFTAFTPDTKTATDIDVSAFPATYRAGKLIVSLSDPSTSNQISVALPACDWKAGYRYVYPITVSQTKLVIGDVQVEPWVNNDSGSINITK